LAQPLYLLRLFFHSSLLLFQPEALLVYAALDLQASSIVL
jgi:hypothetical protein